MTNKLYFRPVYVVLLLSLFWIILCKSIFFIHCSSYYDIGIYSEALKLISIHDLNPFIPGRNIHIFNDHFDPVLIPVSFFERFIPAPWLGMTVEFLIITLCWLPLNMLVRKKKIEIETAIFAYAFIALNHAMVDALSTPFHPTTWAVLPLLYVLCFYWLEEWLKMFLALMVFFACREEFPLVGLTLGTLLLGKKLKWGLLVLITSIAWNYFNFILRPKFFAGYSQSYGSNLFQSFLAHPFAPLLGHVSIGMARMFLSRTLSALLLISKAKFLEHKVHFFKIMWIAAPVLAIRYASTSWGFHYGTAPVVLFLFAVLPPLNASLPSISKWRKIAAWLFLLLIYLSPVLKKGVVSFIGHDVQTPKTQRCPTDPARIRAIDEAQAWIISQLPKERSEQRKKVLVENNLAGSLLFKTRNLDVYIFGTLRPDIAGPFDYVLMEKPPRGDAWPISLERVQELINLWKNSPDVQTVIDNEHVFLGAGKITEDR